MQHNSISFKINQRRKSGRVKMSWSHRVNNKRTFGLLFGCLHYVLYIGWKFTETLTQCKCAYEFLLTLAHWFSHLSGFLQKKQNRQETSFLKLFGETSWTGQQRQRSVPFCCITLHMWFGLSVKCLDIRSPPDESTSRSQLRQTNVNLWGVGGGSPTVTLFPNKTNYQLDKLWHLLTLMRWDFCWTHALEFFSYCETWEWRIWPQDKYCGTTFQRHRCWITSLFLTLSYGYQWKLCSLCDTCTRHTLQPLGNGKRSGRLWRSTRYMCDSRHWCCKRMKHTHAKTVTHKAKGPSWKTFKWIKITEAISQTCYLLLISTWSWRRIAKAKWSRICYC